jgi:uncharacterized protein with PIN domain
MLKKRNRENRPFKVAGIQNLMVKNYQVPTDVLDIEAIVNDGLSMRENWFRVKDKIIKLSPKEVRLLSRDTKHYRELEKYYLECARIELEEHKCPYCNAPFEEVVDSITGKKTGYQWKPMCEHFPKDVRLMNV